MTSREENITDTIFISLWLYIPLESRLTATCIVVLPLHPTQWLYGHLQCTWLHDKATFLLTCRLLSVSLQIFIERPRGRHLCGCLAGKQQPVSFGLQPPQGKDCQTAEGVHRCFKLLKNCPGGGFLQQSPFEAGSEYHFQKRKNKKNKWTPLSIDWGISLWHGNGKEKKVMHYLCGLCHETSVFPWGFSIRTGAVSSSFMSPSMVSDAE